jgi:Protein of unknown function (DUF2510)
VTELSELPAPRRGARAGYYPDPLGGRHARWWDGNAWTLNVGPLVPPEAPRNKALAPPTKVCPRCATQAETFAGNCPNCGRSYTQASPWKIAALIAASGLLLIGGCGGCVLLGAAVVNDELEDQSISRSEFTAVPPGATRAAVESRFGDPVDTYRSQGAVCLEYYEGDQGIFSFDFYEFCFLNGRLVSKHAD